MSFINNYLTKRKITNLKEMLTWTQEYGSETLKLVFKHNELKKFKDKYIEERFDNECPGWKLFINTNYGKIKQVESNATHILKTLDKAKKNDPSIYLCRPLNYDCWSERYVQKGYYLAKRWNGFIIIKEILNNE